jgi:hypothetical protein
MDWIERWFGVVPDNGDGTLELLIVLAVISLVLVPVVLGCPSIRAALNYFFRSNREGSSGGHS